MANGTGNDTCKSSAIRFAFIIQGEGRGHLTQAIALAEVLRSAGHQVVGMMVGASRNREIPKFFIERAMCAVESFESPNFVMGKNNKNINLFRTIVQNMSIPRLNRYAGSVRFIGRKVVEWDVDTVVNFYEMMGSFAATGRKNGIGVNSKGERIKTVGIAHQYMLLRPEFHYERYFGGWFSFMFLKIHAWLSALGQDKCLALSFYAEQQATKSGARIKLIPPILRGEVLSKVAQDKGHILGYMLNQGYANEVNLWHETHKETPLQIFWDKKDVPDELQIDSTLTYNKINDVKFIDLMVSCRAYVTTAGFESVCEAMYHGKPVLMIPSHLEQSINAHDAQRVGAGVIGDRFDITLLLDSLASYVPSNSFRVWVDSSRERILSELE